MAPKKRNNACFQLMGSPVKVSTFNFHDRRPKVCPP